MALRVLVFTVSLLATIGIGCGDPDGTLPDCGAMPDASWCSCDDENPCTIDVRRPDGCGHDAIIPGDDCQGAAGFCDTDGVCREQCEPKPCFDSYVEKPNGCVYTQRKNGWTCTATSGAVGLCADGECDTEMFPKELFSVCQTVRELSHCEALGWEGACVDGWCHCYADAHCDASTTGMACIGGMCVAQSFDPAETLTPHQSVSR